VTTAGSIPGTAVLPKEVLMNTTEDDILKLVVKSVVQDYLGIEVNLSAQHWQNFRHFVLKSVVGKIFDLSNTVQVLMDRNQLIFFHQNHAESPEPHALELGRTRWGYHEFHVASVAGGPVPKLWLRSWEQGDRIQLEPGAHSKLLSDIYVNSKLNLLEKAHWPLVTTQLGKIVWVPGLRKPENTIQRGPWEIKWQTEIRRK
jgi:tRNA(Ile)-lysidine synthetase-like protein